MCAAKSGSVPSGSADRQYYRLADRHEPASSTSLSRKPRIAWNDDQVDAGPNMSAPIERDEETTSMRPKPIGRSVQRPTRSCGEQDRGALDCRRCIGCASGWCRNAPASSPDSRINGWKAGSPAPGLRLMRTGTAHHLATAHDAPVATQWRSSEELRRLRRTARGERVGEFIAGGSGN